MDKESYDLIKERLEKELIVLAQVMKMEEEAHFKRAAYIVEMRGKAKELEKALEDLKSLNDECPIEEKIDNVEKLARDPETLHKLLDLRKTLMDLKNSCREHCKNGNCE